MTLKELMMMIEQPNAERVPTAKCLKESQVPVIAKIQEKGFELNVYQTGYAIYRVEKREAVFAVTLKGDYAYGSVKDGAAVSIDKECAQNEWPWYIRLALEGEDHLVRAQEVRNEKCSSLEQMMEENTALNLIDVRTERSFQRIWEEELMQTLYSCLTEKQFRVLYMHYILGFNQRQIAEEIAVQRTTIQRILISAKKRAKKKLGDAFFERYFD